MLCGLVKAIHWVINQQRYLFNYLQRIILNLDLSVLSSDGGDPPQYPELGLGYNKDN